MAEYEEENMSKFNAGLYKVNRLHKIKELVNFCRLQPKAMNPDYYEFNYILWFYSLNSFMVEILPKLKKEEKLNCYKIKLKIEETLAKFPVQEEIKIISGKKELRWSEKNWIIIKKMFEYYEDKLNQCSDRHNFEMPNADDEGL